MKMTRRQMGSVVASTLLTPPTLAAKRYDPGASDTFIRIGQTMPYSGPASAYSVIGRAQAAYFRKINAEGGIRGRQVELISRDDGYAPPKTYEVTRRMVERDQVLALFQSVGTPTNAAVQAYLNAKRVPQLFVGSGASRWNDPRKHPWTMGWQPNYTTEAAAYARHIAERMPRARIAVLHQNDDYGQDALDGLRLGLGGRAAAMIVAAASYESSDPTIAGQMVQLQASGADVLVNFSTPKFAAQAIRSAFESGWKPHHYLNNVSQSVGAVLKPAGLEKAVGVITSLYNKDPADPQWDADAGMQAWREFMRRHVPGGDATDALNVYAYGAARAMVQVLLQCGDVLTRENVMWQAQNLRNFESGVELPGIRIDTSASRHAPMQSMQLARFDGRSWQALGQVIHIGG